MLIGLPVEEGPRASRLGVRPADTVSNGESRWLVAWWDSPDGSEGITTQEPDQRELQHHVSEAIAAYFDEGAAPRRIRLRWPIACSRNP
jgi:hypothetical protein